MGVLNGVLLMPTPKILVVEDFERFRRFVVSTLQQRTKQIAEASDGMEALQEAEEQHPDLVLLDIGLPSLNGIEVARRLRKLAVPPKIVFISQESSPEVVAEALNLGALGYVHKTRAGSDLQPAIEAALEGRRFVSSGLQIGGGMDGQVQPRHEILFYTDDSVLLDGLARFIASALNAGNPAIAWIDDSHQHSLYERLRERRVDIDGAIQRGLFMSSDTAETPDPRRFLEVIKGLRETAGKQHPRVALCGDLASRLWAEGKMDEAIRLEQQSSELARTHDMDILCAYPLDCGQRNGAFKKIRVEHGAVFT
jgi:DNA-binding NarL/FixJ family response regulator